MVVFLEGLGIAFASSFGLSVYIKKLLVIATSNSLAHQILRSRRHIQQAVLVLLLSMNLLIVGGVVGVISKCVF